MGSYDEFVNEFAIQIGRDSELVAREISLAYHFGKKLESGLYIVGNPDLSTDKTNQRYNNIIKRIIDSNPKEYFVGDFDYLGNELFTKSVLCVLNKIFGSKEYYLDIFTEFTENLSVSGSNVAMDGYCDSYLDNNNKIQRLLILPSCDNTSSVVCALHEFAHYCFERHDYLFEKSYYTEILSILFEKIASDVLSEALQDESITKKIENIRLDCIKYHYTTKKEDVKNLKLCFDNINKSGEIIARKEYAQKLAQDYSAFSEDLAMSYGLGYIYAESLFNLYKTDEKTFQQKMRSIFGFETTLQDTLDYYDINLNNNKVFDQAKQKIRTMTKK